MIILFLFPCPSNEVGDSDSEDPQVYESMCNIQTQAGSSETAQASDLGNVHTQLSLSWEENKGEYCCFTQKPLPWQWAPITRT